MSLTITIDTAAPLTDSDKAILSTLLGTPSGGTIVTEPATKPATRPAPAAKPEPEQEEAEEDLIGGDPEPTVQDAIDTATALVNSGGQARVKAALKATGIDRVSNVPQAKVTAFLAALEG